MGAAKRLCSFWMETLRSQHKRQGGGMSNYTIVLKHRITKLKHHIIAIDGYFGGRIYGFKLPDGTGLDADQLDVFYEPVSPQTAGEEA